MTRTVEASCPPPKVEIDRSFASAPPACVGSFDDFAFPEGAWIDLTVGAAKDIKARSECLFLVKVWLDGERNARLEKGDADG